MTIQEIKQRTKKTAPYYFSADTLNFFNQSLKDFKVKKLNDTEYLIYAPSYSYGNAESITEMINGRFMGYSMRIFDTITNELKDASFVDADLLK